MGGKRFNDDKLRLDLVPPAAENYMAAVLGFGAGKYGDHNYRGAGEKLSSMSIIASLKRHINAYVDGEDNDKESGLSHVAHMLANAGMLAQLLEDGTLVDDRYSPSTERNKT